MFDWLDPIREFVPVAAHDILFALLAAAAGVLVALVAHGIFFRLLRRVAQASESKVDDIVVHHLARPTKWAMVALAIVLAARAVPLLDAVWHRIAGLLVPALIGWIALATLRAVVQAIETGVDITAQDNLQARRRHTRLAIFSRIATFAIVFATVGLMLLSIPGVRDIGLTLVASAGLAALAVGAAAQPALKALIGGLQMALTEPIRIDDVVVVDGEWGKIEDIRTTYVVVKVWDERRLIVPAHKFLEETFENWTRDGSQILAPVLLYLDPLAEIPPIRAEFERLVGVNPLWDGRVCNLQVTDASPEAITVRLLMSAKDAGTAFDLRCTIREAMLAWIRNNQPEAITRSRVEPIGDGGAGDVLVD